MIISKTPFRISLFGGGTDYPKWYREHGGIALGMAINKYCYLTIRRLPPFFEHKHRIIYSRIETVREIDEIVHPAVKAVFRELHVSDGIELHHDGDLPARSGLGSSSSFTVGLLNSLHALEGRMLTRRQLAEEAIHIEQNVIGEAVGSQDQIWAAFGGMNTIEFRQDDSFAVQPVIMSRERRTQLTSRLMLFFTGFSRYATEVAQKKIENLSHREKHLKLMHLLAEQAAITLRFENGNLGDIGRMLHDTWMLKRDLADGVTNTAIDEIYDAARNAGASGGKLLGAGGGGFMLFYVEPQHQDAVRQALSKLIHVKFDIAPEGSKIVVYEPEGL